MAIVKLFEDFEELAQIVKCIKVLCPLSSSFITVLREESILRDAQHQAYQLALTQLDRQFMRYQLS